MVLLYLQVEVSSFWRFNQISLEICERGKDDFD